MGASVLVAVLVTLTACSGDEDRNASSDDAAATTASTVAADVAPTTAPGTAATEEVLVLGRLEAERADPPVLLDGGLQVVMEPLETDSSRRSEAYWGGDDDVPFRFVEGDKIISDFYITPRLGESAEDPVHWAVVWQLIGPMGEGPSWPAPPLTLTVSNGTWKVGGGDGYPGGSRETFQPPFPAYREGEKVHWRLEVTISSDTRLGSVTAYYNGVPIVEDWHPPAGTRYPEQWWLQAKSGLYTGAGNAGMSLEPRSILIEDARTVVVPGGGSPQDTGPAEDDDTEETL